MHTVRSSSRLCCGGGLPQCMLGYPSPGADPPKPGTPRADPPGADPPPDQAPPEQIPPAGPGTAPMGPHGPGTPGTRHPPKQIPPVGPGTAPMGPRGTRHPWDQAPPWDQGCARFAEILSELTKTWSSGATECGVWIGNCNVKCENLPSTNSTKSGAH